MKYNIIIILLFISCSVRTQNILPIWESKDTTGGSSFYYKLPILAVDSFHNVLELGETYSPGPLIGFYITKRSPSGQKIWTNYFDGPGQDNPSAMIVDSLGSVYVMGNSQNIFTNQRQFIIIKYDSQGQKEWEYLYSTDSMLLTLGSSLILTTDQEIIAIGSFQNVNPNTPGKGLLAVKLDFQKNEIWRVEYTDGNNEFGFGTMKAKQIGNHIQVWGVHGAAQGIKFVSWRITDGAEIIGEYETVPYFDDYGGAIHVDNNGNLYVGDYAGEYKVTKYDLFGNEKWVYKKPFIDRPNSNVDARLECIETDKIGNVYVGGIYNTDSIAGIMAKIISKIDSNGVLLWEDVYFGPDSVLDISVNTVNWITDDLLLFDGVYVEDPINKHYQISLNAFNENGPYWAGKSSISGYVNNPTSIIPDGLNFYIAGTFTSLPGLPGGYFLCKYPLSVVQASQLYSNHKSGTELSVFPNPIGTEFRISLQSDCLSRHSKLIIYNANGTAVFNEDINLNIGENDFEIKDFVYPPGSYIITILTNNNVFSRICIKK